MTRSSGMEDLLSQARRVADIGCERVHLRRQRHRQGAARQGDPQGQPARGSALRRRELRRDSRGPARVRAVRPQERLVHRRGGRPPRPVPGRAGRHPVPRRDRRHAAAAAGQAAAGAGRTQDPAGGLARELRRERARHRRDAPQARGAHRVGRVPGRPLLPAERGEALHPDAGRAARRHSAARQQLPLAPGGALSQEPPGASRPMRCSCWCRRPGRATCASSST